MQGSSDYLPGAHLGILDELVHSLDYKLLRGHPKTVVSGIAYDSRQVQFDTLFVALPGLKTDGHNFLSQAVQNGASALIIQTGREDSLPPGSTTALSTPNTRLALAAVSAEFFYNCSVSLNITGITGTNGKSTTAHLVDTVYRAAGFKTGLIGTLGYHVHDQAEPAPRTTPEAPDLHALFFKMEKAGIGRVTMEVSSHALSQHRVDFTEFRTAVFTNLSRDHLDYHPDEESYFQAKARLFTDKALFPADRERINIINADDPAGQRLASIAAGRTITYGLHDSADLHAVSPQYHPDHTEAAFDGPWGKGRFSLKLLGSFNLYNALAALAVAFSQNIHPDIVIPALETASPPPGRFLRVPDSQYTVIVDYAHTPDGLEKVLSAARPMTSGRLIVVFGCGGDRDPGKRPIMGALAARLADRVIVTSDNPRSENPDAIIQAILAGIPAEDKDKVAVEPDRAAAIRRAISLATEQDLVLLAGKGHETYQIFADKTVPFDDREQALLALQEKRAHRNSSAGEGRSR